MDRLRKLANRIRGDVRLGVHDRMLYATDASIYQVEPMGVIVPSDLDDAIDALRACYELGLPILPRGGGTSLAGQCVNHAVVIDVSARCRGVVGIDPVARTCRAEAGISIGQLNEKLAHDPSSSDLLFAPDPATAAHATIGGCIGNNAAGSRSIKYGRMSENVLGVEVCLADGTRVTLEPGAGERDPIARDLAERVMEICDRHASLIRERFPKTIRRNAGYALDMILAQMDRGETADTIDLAPLMCGSEGTLAFTLSATLRLCPRPTNVGLAVVSFPGIDDAISAVMPLLSLGPSAVELLDGLILRLARDNIEQREHVEMLAGGTDVSAMLYVEFRAGGEGEVDDTSEKLDRVRELFDDRQVECYTDPASIHRAWALRRAGEPLLHGIPGERKPIGFVEDAAVPPERLLEYVTRLRRVIEAEHTTASYYAHASVGVLHVRPLLNLRDEADMAAMERIAIASADLAKELGGVMSGEHGDGRVRGPLLERYYGSELMDAFREIKGVFDPGNLCNPGNLVEPRSIDSIHRETRISAEVSIERDVSTFFDFSDQGGLYHAASLCNGAGVCRKTSGGTMCPSYRATLDERHSTRGRGNALRLAMSGQFKHDDKSWDDAETMSTLDLCLSCKACKSECPSNVDVGKMKAEFIAQRNRSNGRVPAADRFFGHVHLLNRLAGLAPGLANTGIWLLRPIANLMLGLHRDRSLPRYAKPLHKQWEHHVNAPVRPGDRDRASSEPEKRTQTVVLYADTFSTYIEPEIGLAAKRVLEAFGYRVRLFLGSDAGRAMISAGLLDEAIVRLDMETQLLSEEFKDPHAPALAVLFLEPSCLSAVKDEWLSLRCKTPESARRHLAERSFLVEQFLADFWDDHKRRPNIRELKGDVYLHAHCHQKALWGAGSSGDFLERCFPGRIRTLDTTCCGLAGNFGYSRKRFDLSMRIAELGLLPAVRAAGESDVVVAPGTSCRHQVRDGIDQASGKRALHPMELVEQFIEPRAHD